MVGHCVTCCRIRTELRACRATPVLIRADDVVITVCRRDLVKVDAALQMHTTASNIGEFELYIAEQFTLEGEVVLPVVRKHGMRIHTERLATTPSVGRSAARR